MGRVPRLRQRGHGRLSERGGSCLGVSATGVQKDAVLRKPLRHVLQPEQPPGLRRLLGLLLARPLQPGGDQPGVPTRWRSPRDRLRPPAPPPLSAPPAVLDISQA